MRRAGTIALLAGIVAASPVAPGAPPDSKRARPLEVVAGDVRDTAIGKLDLENNCITSAGALLLARLNEKIAASTSFRLVGGDAHRLRIILATCDVHEHVGADESGRETMRMRVAWAATWVVTSPSTSPLDSHFVAIRMGSFYPSEETIDAVAAGILRETDKLTGG